MKRIYWRPQKVSRTVLAFLAIFALAGLVTVEHFKIRVMQPHYKEKIKASRMARDAMEEIKAERLRQGYEIDPQFDPAKSGLIGVMLSEVTSNSGYLHAKQTSINPNFAAVIVHMLKRAGVKEGDKVAVGFSGSFPALNICTLAALSTLGAEPVAISSATASQWGANLPGLLWIDMERILIGKRLFPETFRTVAASLGGTEDRAAGMSKNSRNQIADAITTRNGLRFIKSKDYMDSLEQRMQIFDEFSDEKGYAAYINVGGGTISVGSRLGKKMFKPGLNMKTPVNEHDIDSVMMRFSNRGVPVIHLSQIEELATKYKLAHQPVETPVVGKGSIYFEIEYNKWLALGVLALIVLFLYAFIRSDLGFRILRRGSRSDKGGQPEQMV